MTTDTELLAQYAENGSENAFRELVNRYANLVFSAALRRAGDPDLARDITQEVFSDLARKAKSLSPRVSVAGWLYKSAQYAASQLIRSESRRRILEKEVVTMSQANEDDDTTWRQLAPVLDTAMSQLRERDRDALLLRFFRGQSLREVGLAQGVTEDAARMRVDRALEKLRAILVRHGVTSTAAGLAALLTAQAASAAPAGLALAVAGTALAGAASTTASATFTLLKLMTVTKLKAGLIATVVVAGLATGPIVLFQRTRTLAADNAALRILLTNANLLLAKAQSAPKQSAEGPFKVSVESLDAELASALDQPTLEAIQEALSRLADRVAFADIPSVLKKLVTRPSQLVAPVFKRLLARWVRTDPAGALAFAQTFPPKTRIGHAPFWAISTRTVLTEWAAQDPAAAAAWVKQWPHGLQRQDLFVALILGMAGKDPRLAAEFLASTNGIFNKRDLEGALLGAWADKDPAGAAQAALNPPFNMMGMSAASEWGSRDPQGALNWAQSLPAGKKHEDALTAVLTGWSARDPQAALDFELSQPLSGKQTDFIRNVVLAWSFSEPGEAMNWATNLPVGPNHDAAVQTAMLNWSEVNPQAALQYAEQLPAEQRTEMRGRSALAWLDRDPAAALAWAKGLTGREQQMILSSMVGSLLRSNPNLATDFVGSLPAGQLRDDLIQRIAPDWGQQDAPAVAAWLASLGDEKAKVRVLPSVVQNWAQYGPQDAATFVAKLSAGQDQTAAAAAVVDKWVYADPQGAARWVSGFPDGDARNAAVSSLLTGWVRSDPQSAVAWAESASSEPQRNYAMECAAKAWLQQDNAAACAWVRNSPLPEATKLSLLAPRPGTH